MRLSDDEEERAEMQREKRERYLALQRRRNELRAQISSLESTKSEYICFKSSIGVLEKKLMQLNGKLNTTADNLLNGLIVDGVPLGESFTRETAQLASEYATNLTENYPIIENKIDLLTTEISQKYSELASLG